MENQVSNFVVLEFLADAYFYGKVAEFNTREEAESFVSSARKRTDNRYNHQFKIFELTSF
ncbi:MAG: hypothetical protein MJZ30_11465 [Paludibacteraceae bacterium]|nr:hypothetical protein [Paludibacteraceae bacterium]